MRFLVIYILGVSAAALSGPHSLEQWLDYLGYQEQGGAEVYYIRSDGAGGVTGGDGSVLDPFGTLGEMDSAVSLDDGDSVYIDTETNGPLLESWSRSNLVGVTFSPWPGTGMVRVLNVALVPVENVYDIGGGDSFDSYVSGVGVLDERPESVVEDWDTRLTEDGIRYGFLPEVSSVDDLREERGWIYDSGRLLVSVPDGDSGEEHVYYAGMKGDAIVLTHATRVTFNSFSFELATEAGNGNGYGLRIVGKCKDVVLNNCEGDGNQYHSIGSVGSGTDGFVLNDCVFRSITAGTDSHFVLYTSLDPIENVVLNNPVFYMVPWLDYAGEPLEAGSIQAFAAHHLPGAAPTPAGGILIRGMKTIDLGYNPTANHYGFTLVANHTNHGAPANPFRISDYPIIVTDSVFGAGGVSAGGGFNAQVHIAFDRCRFDFQTTEVVSGMSTNGHISSQSGAGSDTTVFLRSCTISGEVNDIAVRSLVSCFTGGAELILKSCSVYLRGSYTNATYLLYGVSSTGKLTVLDSIFDKEDQGSGRSFLGGSLNLKAQSVFARNLYSSSLPNMMHDFSGSTKLVFLSVVDVEGVYDEPVGFDDEVSLRPDLDLRALRSSAGRGPAGVNRRSYGHQFGAWQYGRFYGPATRK